MATGASGGLTKPISGRSVVSRIRSDIFSAMFLGGLAVAPPVAATLKFAEYEGGMKQIKRAIADATDLDLAKLKDKMLDVNYASFAELTDAAIEAGKMGFSMKDIFPVTTSILKASKAADLDVGQTVTNLGKMFSLLNIKPETHDIPAEVTKIMNMVTNFENRLQAVKAKDIMNVSARAVSHMEGVGFSTEERYAMSAMATQKYKTPKLAASGIKLLLEGIEGMSKKGYGQYYQQIKSEGFEGLLSVMEQLRKIDPTVLYQDMGLEKTGRTALFRFSGKEGSGIEDLRKAKTIAQTSTGNVEREFAIWLESMNFFITKLKKRFNDFVAQFGEALSPIVKAFIDVVSYVFKVFTDILKEYPIIAQGIGIILGAIATLVVFAVTIVGFIASLTLVKAAFAGILLVVKTPLFLAFTVLVGVITGVTSALKWFGKVLGFFETEKAKDYESKYKLPEKQTGNVRDFMASSHPEAQLYYMKAAEKKYGERGMASGQIFSKIPGFDTLEKRKEIAKKFFMFKYKDDPNRDAKVLRDMWMLKLKGSGYGFNAIVGYDDVYKTVQYIDPKTGKTKTTGKLSEEAKTVLAFQKKYTKELEEDAKKMAEQRKIFHEKYGGSHEDLMLRLKAMSEGKVPIDFIIEGEKATMGQIRQLIDALMVYYFNKEGKIVIDEKGTVVRAHEVGLPYQKDLKQRELEEKAAKEAEKASGKGKTKLESMEGMMQVQGVVKRDATVENKVTVEVLGKEPANIQIETKRTKENNVLENKKTAGFYNGGYADNLYAFSNAQRLARGWF